MTKVTILLELAMKHDPRLLLFKEQERLAREERRLSKQRDAENRRKVCYLLI